jgi:ABC-type uncharacterized transport system ATPase subunit
MIVMRGVMMPDGGECDIDGRTPWKNRLAHVREKEGGCQGQGCA